MKKKIQHLILMEYKEGKTDFLILGEGELADIVELSLKNLGRSGLEYMRVPKLEDINSSNAVVLLTHSKPGFRIEKLGPGDNKCIDVLAILSGS